MVRLAFLAFIGVVTLGVMHVSGNAFGQLDNIRTAQISRALGR